MCIQSLSNVVSYTNDAGDKVSFTKAQAGAFKAEYAKSNSAVSEMLRLTEYKAQDDKTKACLISRIYSAYKESANAKALGTAPNSKLGKLLYYTNGDIDLAKYIIGMQAISSIGEDKKHSRKENVVAAINKMAGFAKQEKILLAYLSGYVIGESGKLALMNFLIGKGFSKKEAQSYLRIE